ncbi:MAG: tetratricopeptide repeat protein [Candidatus Nitronauta litoralis]|uniref:Tetratricopeptide repeat protein n=1 Tax=Candidatus Nitronauta litoralis TaxID=2705533 RepID=A0A7T0BWE6_9BACT|nr:MAG: tetratricopeptide repeat protein [Candidatus Nitronauta litoralis]
MPSINTPNQHRLVFIFIVAAISLGVALGYSSVLHSPFNFDDGLVVLNNRAILNLATFFQLHTIHYRHLFYLTFAFNYHLGQEDPFGYHLFNIGVHLVNSLLVFAVVRITVEKGCDWGRSSAMRIATLTALVFAFNPIQTEAVSYISGRTSSLMAMFYLLSLMGFIQAETRQISWKGRVFCYSLCFLAGASAILSKETAITLPAALLLYDVCFMRNKNFRTFKPRILWVYGPVLLSISCLFFLSPSMWEHVVTWSQKINPGYALQQLTVIPFGAKMVLFPINQVFDYDWPYSSLSTDTLRIFSSLLAVGIFSGIWLKLYRAFPLAAFGVGWFLLILSPTNSFLPRMDLLSERNLYLASFGLLLIGAATAECVGFGARSSKIARLLVTVCAAIVVVCFMTLLIHRNAVYESNISLWEDALKKNPGKPRIYHNLSHFYTERKDFDNAFIMLKKLAASNATPYYRSYAHTNLGNIYALWGDMANAEREFVQAVQIYPRLPSGHFNLGVLFATRGMDKEAHLSFNRARAAKKYHPQKHLLPPKIALYQGRVLLNLKRYDRAEKEARRFLKEKPNHIDGQLLLGEILEEGGKSQEALDWYQSIRTKIKEKHLSARIEASIARIHLNHEQWKQAIGALERSLTFDPTNGPRQYFLGKLFWEHDNRAKAEKHIREALALHLDPALTLEAEALLTEIESE